MMIIATMNTSLRDILCHHRRPISMSSSLLASVSKKSVKMSSTQKATAKVTSAKKTSAAKKSSAEAAPPASSSSSASALEPPPHIELSTMRKLVNELRSTSLVLKKLTIMKSAPIEYIDFMHYLVKPGITFGVTSNALKKHSTLGIVHNVKEKEDKKSIKRHVVTDKTTKEEMLIRGRTMTLSELLNALATRQLTGHTAIGACNVFSANLKHHKTSRDESIDDIIELFHCILDRDLKTRVSNSLLMRMYNNGNDEVEHITGTLIKKNVALAKAYPNKEIFHSETEWFASRKLDGVRVLCVIAGPDVRPIMYTRNGTILTSLDVVIDKIVNIMKESSCITADGLVFDGEVCVIDNSSGIESFTKSIGVMQQKGCLKSARYFLFDCMTIPEFQGVEESPKLSLRLSKIKHIFNSGPSENSVCVLDQETVTCEDDLLNLHSVAKKKGWEGIMLRNNIAYKRGRTSGLLKVKHFMDDEFRVQSTVTGPMRMFIDGTEQEVETLSAIVIDYHGQPVSVGSGFTFEQRMHFHEHPEDIIGRLVKVQYFGESTRAAKTKTEKNMLILASLRFPTVKHIYSTNEEVERQTKHKRIK